MMLKTRKLNFQVHHRGKFLIMALYIWAVTLATADEAAPHCSSTFHVWQPGQEAQQMIREMYLKMDNLTSYTKFEVRGIMPFVCLLLLLFCIYLKETRFTHKNHIDTL